MDDGHAYRCFCTFERLSTIAKERQALGLPTEYDRTCLNIPVEQSQERAQKGDPHILRLKMPEAIPSFNDLIYGVVKDKRLSVKPGSQLGVTSYEDPVLIKSDGLPTYHLANVVDDYHMGITHVIRAAVRFLCRLQFLSSLQLMYTGMDVLHAETQGDVRRVWVEASAVRSRRSSAR